MSQSSYQSVQDVGPLVAARVQRAQSRVRVGVQVARRVDGLQNGLGERLCRRPRPRRGVGSPAGPSRRRFSCGGRRVSGDGAPLLLEVIRRKGRQVGRGHDEIPVAEADALLGVARATAVARGAAGTAGGVTPRLELEWN